MKKTMLGLGYFAAICILLSFIYKILHIPGANPLMLVGCAAFILGFAPLLFLIRNKVAENATMKITNVLICLTMAVVGLSVCMKYMHFNYSEPVAIIGIILVGILTILMIFQAVSQKDDRWSVNYHTTAILLVIAVSMIVFIWKSRTPVQILEDFDQIILTQNNEIKFFNNKTNAIFENLDKSPNNNAAAAYYQKSVEVKDKADSLVRYLRAIGEELMYKADNKSVSFDSIQLLSNRENRRITAELMIDQKKDSIFSISFADFKTFIEPNTNSRGKEILDQFFTIKDSTYKFQGENVNWSSFRFHQSLISVLVGLNSDILHIRMLEAETINYLQTMQAKAMFKSE